MRLVLRRPQATDLAPYTVYCTSDHARFVGGPFTAESAFEKLAAMIGHWDLRGFGRLVICERATMRPVGHVGAMQISANDPAEMTWTLWSPDDQGKGYAYEAARAYLDTARANYGFATLIARIAPDNLRSLRLARRLGGTIQETHPAPHWFPDARIYAFVLDESA
jgi:ribosomal-protein-alanine N-acetyltransferase